MDSILSICTFIGALVLIVLTFILVAFIAVTIGIMANDAIDEYCFSRRIKAILKSRQRNNNNTDSHPNSSADGSC